MSVSDLKANALTMIRNAVSSGKEKVDIRKSKLLLEIVKILKKEHFINDLREVTYGNQGLIRIYLKYGPDDRCAIKGIKQISKPGLRVYAKKDAIPKVLNGNGIAVLSTSKGVFTDSEARKNNIGGEVICYIW